MIKKNSAIAMSKIIVFDIGCRFGIHPTWKALKHSPFLDYYAFDPDPVECNRLRSKYSAFNNYKVFDLGFSDKEEKLELNFLSHKGQSSFLEPNPESLWFSEHRKSDSLIESKLECNLTTLNIFCEENSVTPNFLKIDTEGFDYKVLSGGARILDNVLAIRCEVAFESTFKNSATFDLTYRLLTNAGFSLANIDYDGRGVPNSYFCPDQSRYGMYCGGEALFIKQISKLDSLAGSDKLKIILFCFFNNLQDLSFRLLMGLENREIYYSSDIWIEIKRQFCHAARKFLYMPGDHYKKVMRDYKYIFAEDFPDKHEFFQSNFLNPA
jgi:FkbM family methyltransferase